LVKARQIEHRKLIYSLGHFGPRRKALGPTTTQEKARKVKRTPGFAVVALVAEEVFLARGTSPRATNRLSSFRTYRSPIRNVSLEEPKPSDDAGLRAATSR